MDEFKPKAEVSRSRQFPVRIIFIIGFLLCIFVGLQLQAPSSFKSDTTVTIDGGGSLMAAAYKLKTAHVIRSETIFETLVILLQGEHSISAGDYYFDKPISAYTVASRLAHGVFGLSQTKVTFPEGSTRAQMAAISAEKFTKFSVTDFLAETKDEEGYLFPDTYFFNQNAIAADIAKKLQSTFEEKESLFASSSEAFGKPLHDVITMASLLEEEAKTPRDWQIIAGILWKRLKLGMPLQVDSTIGYVTGKPNSHLTSADLKINSPYNTYRFAGLPPTPISNPGLATIEAALNPITTPYFYYISDRSGNMHYAISLDDHIANEKKYLQ